MVICKFYIRKIGPAKWESYREMPVTNTSTVMVDCGYFSDQQSAINATCDFLKREAGL